MSNCTDFSGNTGYHLLVQQAYEEIESLPGTADRVHISVREMQDLKHRIAQKYGVSLADIADYENRLYPKG